MAKSRYGSHRHKRGRGKRVFRLLLLATVVLGFWLGGGLLFNAEHLREIAVKRIEAISGQTIMVKGAARFTLFPSPTLTLPLIELTQDQANAAVPLRAQTMTVHLTWASAFSGEATVSAIRLRDATITLSRTPEGKLNISDFTAVSKAMQASSIASFAIDDGRLLLADTAGTVTTRFDNLRLVLQQGNASLKGNALFQYRDQPFQLTWSMTGDTMKAALNQPDSKATLEGQWVNSGAASTFSGTLAGNWSHIETLLGTAPRPAYPISFSTAIEYNTDTKQLSLDGITIKTPDSAGQGSITATLADRPTFAVNMQFSQLRVNMEDITPLLGSTPASTLEESEVLLPDFPEQKILPENYDIALTLAAEHVNLANREIRDVALKAHLEKGNLRINRVDFELPSNGSVVLAGDVIDTARGLRFQGATRAEGQSLRALLALFDTAAYTLPDKGFGAFSITSNLFISSTQLRLSEADVVLGDLTLQGGLVSYFEKSPAQVEADVVLKDINLDYFRDTWRVEQRSRSQQGFTFRINSSVDFRWLRQLSPLINFKVRLNGFTFLDHRGDVALFKLYAKQNEFGLTDVKLHYPEGDLTGDVVVNVTQESPLITLNLRAPFLDTLYFSADSGSLSDPLINPAPESPEERWSKQLFDFSWMIGVSSKVNIGIGRLTHRGNDYNDFVLQGVLQNEQFHYSKLSFDRFGGHMDAAGTLIGGKVPGLSTNFTLYNADMAELLKSLMGLEQPSGRISISGTLVTSGIHFLSWVSQADMKMVIAARGVKAPRFNLKAILEAVNRSGSVAQVANNIERVLPSGATEMSVDGNLNLKQGIMVAPGLKLQAGQAVGTLTGEWRLIPWTMRFTTLWSLPMLPSDTVPTLTLDVAGTPQEYTLRTDTSSLEAYIAKRIVGQ